LKIFIQHCWRFFQRPDFESNKINEKVYLDLDEAGNLIGMINGHPLLQADISETSFQQINCQVA
jgi:uncharacterized protein YuzE